MTNKQKSVIITVEHLTIGQATDLSERARDLQSKTDQFLKQDLYHIIGMGNLSASQSAALNKLVKGITEHRTVIKTLAGIPTLPNKVSNISTYKATAFGLNLKNKNIVIICPDSFLKYMSLNIE